MRGIGKLEGCPPPWMKKLTLALPTGLSELVHIHCWENQLRVNGQSLGFEFAKQRPRCQLIVTEGSAWKTERMSVSISPSIITSALLSCPLFLTPQEHHTLAQCLIHVHIHTLSFQQPSGDIPNPISWMRTSNPQINVFDFPQLLTQSQHSSPNPEAPK